MKIRLSILFALLFISYDSSSQIGRLALSPLQTLEQKIGLTEITIVYCRPSMRGREIFGDLVPYDKMWRTGANRNTTIQFSDQVNINGAIVKAGKYAIFTVPSRNEWEIIFYDDTSNWNVPENFDEAKVVARAKVMSEKLPSKHEVLTIIIGDFTNYQFDLVISWSDTQVSLPIHLNTKEVMDKRIDNILGGPTYQDYYAAAEYQMESGHDFQKGLDYILKGMELTDNIIWWDLRLQSILLMELGRKDEAKEVAEKGLKMAQEVNRQYGIDEFNKILKKLQM